MSPETAQRSLIPENSRAKSEKLFWRGLSNTSGRSTARGVAYHQPRPAISPIAAATIQGALL